MFPFYRGNPPPVLVGGCLIFYIFLRKEKAGTVAPALYLSVVMALYKPLAPRCFRRCLPLYFGQDFAREQRIGNPAALAAVCRGFLPAGSPCIAASLLCYLRICNRCTVSGCVSNEILKNVRGNLTPILQDKICR